MTVDSLILMKCLQEKETLLLNFKENLMNVILKDFMLITCNEKITGCCDG